jgi:hypothetical protein
VFCSPTGGESGFSGEEAQIDGAYEFEAPQFHNFDATTPSGQRADEWFEQVEGKEVLTF